MDGGNKLQEDGNLVHDNVLGHSETWDKKIRQKEKHRKDDNLKTLSEQLNEVPVDSYGDTRIGIKSLGISAVEEDKSKME
ncbi:unnamed protein product [Ilex paraguariensis]|uniref:Uncharacterized protein n=1 Tax=Ilex paraguariensis TaxID=185542 RepID=A0ABC8S2I7_9AQUA